MVRVAGSVLLHACDPLHHAACTLRPSEGLQALQLPLLFALPSLGQAARLRTSQR